MTLKTAPKLFLFFFFFIFSISVSAATITVNTLTDENNTNAAACSLREAINNANNDNTTNGLGCNTGTGMDTIVFDVTGTINLSAVLPDISSSIIIGINTTTAPTITINRNSGGNYRIFKILSGNTVILNGLIVNNGNSAADGGAISNGGTLTVNNSIFSNNTSVFEGGAIASGASTVLTVNDSTFNNNSATNQDGGAIGSYGNTSVSRSTFNGNSSNFNGGAISILSGGGFNGSITSTNNTFFNNTANVTGGAISFNTNSSNSIFNCTINANKQINTGTSGGGISVLAGNVGLNNTIVINNTKNNNLALSDITVTSGSINAGSSNNLIGAGGSGGLTNGINGNQVGVADAFLLPLGNYGGLVQSMPIRTNSPARNAGTNTGAPATDARGFNRPQATTTDIGAFEIQTNSVVTNVLNSGAGSLRDVVAAVPSGEVVQFDTPTFNSSQSIFLSTGQITINKNLTIYGNAANLLNVQNTQAAGASSRVFNILTGNTVVLNGMSISGGNVTDSGGGILQAGSTNLTLNGCILDINTAAVDGGGIRSTGTLAILNSAITNNSANGAGGLHGGGIDFSGTSLTITNSTISGNSSLGGNTNGGGIWTNNSTVITNSTITNNTVNGANSGSGIYQTSAILTTVRNSIIAGNINNAAFPDVFGGYNSSGYNLVGNRGTSIGFTQPTDITGTSPLFDNADEKSLAPSAVVNPSLLPLAMNGGTVPTHSPRGDSLVIDKGNSFGSTTDARGLLRPVDLAGFANAAGGDGADIGAYEFQLAPTAANVSVSGRVLTASGAGLTNTLVYLTASNGTTRTVKTTSFGNFVFENVTSGETYTISIVSRKLQFAPQILTVNESVAGLDFTAIEQ